MKAQQEYESLTERIEAQKEKKLNRFIAALAAVIQESDEEPAKDTSSEEDDEDIVLISLFSLRIKTECELIREGSRDLVEQVKEDIEELVSHVQSFEYESTISEMVRSDAYDLLKSICLEEDREMIQQNYNWNLPWKAAVGIPQEMFFLFMSTAAYMQNIGKNGEAVKVLEALCTYSRKRGNKNHKEVIFRAISQMGGDSPEAICRIGDAEQQLFAGDTSLYAGDFYWFYGDSLQNLGRAEDAMHVFEQCFQIRKNCLGEENYYTELARRGRAICEFSCTNGREGRADLLHFVDRIESGDFEDQENPEQLQIFELKTLCIALMGMSDHSSNQNAYRRYLELYIQLCRKYKDTGETCASMRMAWNFLGAFYMNVGEYMQAEEAFQQALKAEASDEEISMLSTIDIQSNLLLIYYVQNDQEKAYPLLDEMYRLTEEEEEQQTIREETLDRMDTLAVALRMQMMDQADSEELADLSDLLVETCTDLLSADAGTITREKAVFAIICMLYLMQQESGTKEEQKYFCRTLQRIEQESQILDLTAMQTAMLEYGKALLLWNLGQEEADASFRSLIDKMENRGIQPLQKAAIYQSYGTVLCRNGRNTEGFSYLERSLDEATNRIEQQNYAAAEDLLNRVLTQDLDPEFQFKEEDYLEEFLDEYDVNYRKTANSGTTLKALMNTSKINKDIKGGNKLLENWPKGAGTNETTLKVLLSTFGFQLESVQREAPVLGKIENYTVKLKRPENGRKSNYKHPIAAFGSEAEEKGFRVICLFGKTDASRLIDTFKEVGNAKHTLVLLDYALPLAERRILARKTKTDLSGKIFAVVDRVVLVYLAKHYTETAMNRMLMAVIMPFASYQPYIDKSVDIMPQEIFIGRKYELEKIESPTGINIVYGGRQLGKSALLRMAKKDIDHNENGDRAVLVDIKDLDYKASARKISAALFDEGILKEEHITEDWSELARDLKKRLKDTDDSIPYFLLLLDEADTFIDSCESIKYWPFDMLKDIQSVGMGRFKFVVAGLRNIVRFKREAALGNNSVLTHLESLTVKPFKAMEARELLEVPLSYLGFRFPEDNETEVLISTILGTTNYFPGLLQLYCTKLIEAMQRDYAGYSESETPPYLVKKEHIKKVLAEQTLQEEIRKKFFITLVVGDDDYYYIIALMVAYLYHENKSENGCSADELLELAEGYSIKKILTLGKEQLAALMEEMRELYVLQNTSEGRYRFTRYSFCQMMGTIPQINDELEKYMED